MQRRGFDPPLGRIFSGTGDFSLELTWVMTPFLKSLSGESMNRDLIHAPHAFHRMYSKDPDNHVLDG